MTTNHATIGVDRDAVRTSFREWEAEQAELDRQIAESVDALAAYQSHLDAWQQQLAAEREELRDLRARLECDQEMAGAEHAHLEAANNDLNEARQQISSLTALLLARTEELRELDHQRGDANTELANARTRELEVAAALAAQQQSFVTERQQWEKERTHLRQQLERAVDLVSSRPAARNDTTPSTTPERPRSTSPVLGSVMEQFGKLRQQRSQSRATPKQR